jgi:N-acyl-L-homoserine lactone synthetase
MQVTTLSFGNIHNHGELFYNLFRARHESFIKQNKWDLPQADGMEFDQYDTPASRWIAVHEFGNVLAGVRLTPTTARCGIYSYMIRDAQRGLLETIPAELLYDEAPIAQHIWEGTRIFVSNRVPSSERTRVKLSLMVEMCRAARDLGATSVLGLIPANGLRWTRRVGLDLDVAGPVIGFNDGTPPSRCVWLNLAGKMH